MKRLLLILFLGIGFLPGWGEGIRMRIAPERISTDESATLFIEVEGGVSGAAPRIELPQGIQSAGSATRHALVNGRQTTTFQYQIHPAEPGEYTIGPFQMTLNQRPTEVGPVQLSVHAAPVLSASDDMFIRMTASHDRVLVQQPVELSVTLYSIHRIDDIQLAEFDAPGFETGDWDSFQQRDQMIDGQRYLVRRFTTRAIPTSPGNRELAPVFRIQTLEPEALTRGERGIFTRRLVRRTHRMRPEPVSLLVESPPADGRPPEFTGAIGRFVLEGAASPRHLTVGDPITLRVQIQGTGNLRNLLPPSLPESDDFQVFAPRLVEEDVARDGMRGRKTIEQVIVPRHAEISEIPAIRFSFFDPDNWRYETRSIGPFPLDVTPAPVRDTFSPAGLTGTLRLGTGPTILGQDLVYLKAEPGRHIRITPANPVAFLSWSALPLLTWALLGFWFQKKEHLARNPALARRRQAPKKLRRQLDAISKLAADDAKNLHEPIWNCLAVYLADRFQFPPGEVDPDRVASHLQHALAPETLTHLQTWLQSCQRARFSGNILEKSPQETAQETASKFSEFMLRLDQEVAT